jgi:hypothetical protein
MPDDFDFIAKFGVAEEYLINTFNNTYTKKITWDKDTTISLVFPDEEKEKVYQKIKRYEIDKLPGIFEPDYYKEVAPSPTYYLKFKLNGSIYEILWETNTLSKEKRAKNLRDIFKQIDTYLESQEVIKSLPEDRRGVF